MKQSQEKQNEKIFYMQTYCLVLPMIIMIVALSCRDHYLSNYSSLPLYIDNHRHRSNSKYGGKEEEDEERRGKMMRGNR